MHINDSSFKKLYSFGNTRIFFDDPAQGIRIAVDHTAANLFIRSLTDIFLFFSGIL